MNKIIKKLYEFLTHNSEKSEVFDLWKADFIAIHGLLDTQRKLDIDDLCSNCEIECISNENVFQLVFCLETYYTIVLRGLAFQTVFNQKTLTLSAFDSDSFKAKGIENYNSKPYFNWFIAIPNILNDINTTASEFHIYLTNPEEDFIKAIFESIFPSAVKHAMGEFYTPDWLANFVIETITEKDEFACEKTYLVPTCGSGTFIFNVIRQFQKKSEN